MAKIERKYMAHFLNASFGQAAGTASYERLGQDLEEYSAEMNAQVDTTNNILGQEHQDLQLRQVRLGGAVLRRQGQPAV